MLCSLTSLSEDEMSASPSFLMLLLPIWLLLRASVSTLALFLDRITGPSMFLMLRSVDLLLADCLIAYYSMFLTIFEVLRQDFLSLCFLEGGASFAYSKSSSLQDTNLTDDRAFSLFDCKGFSMLSTEAIRWAVKLCLYFCSSSLL